MATPPILPPKTRTGSFRSFDRKSISEISRPHSIHTVGQTIAKPKQAASFMNPLYYEVQTNQFSRHSRSRTPTYPDNDTDSICFLERHKPDLTPFKQYMESPANLRPRRPSPDVGDHVYELCDVLPEETPTPERKISDIFDLVSFKSPLYGTVTSVECSPESEWENYPQLYDVPGTLPPPYPPPPLPDETDFGDGSIVVPPPLPKRTAAKLPHIIKKEYQDNVQVASKYNPDVADGGVSSSAKSCNVPTSTKSSDVSSTKSCDVPSSNDQLLRKPTGIQMCGFLFKVGQSNRDICKRWFALEGPVLCCYLDDKSDIPLEAICVSDINGITSTHFCIDTTQQCTDPSVELWHFTIHTERSKHVQLAARLPSDRSDWVEILTLAIFSPAKLIGLSNCLCSGHLYVKEGITAQWQRAFVSLYGRQIKLWIQNESKSINLQKASVINKESGRLSSALAKETGPFFYIDLTKETLYFQADWTMCTEAWLSCVQQSWLVPASPTLADEYLTADDVPIIINKCLKFVSTFGTTMEGIYRLSGSSSKIRELLQLFRDNAWNVHLKEEDYSPHDVASVLKRYLRTLSQCLMTDDLYNMWVAASGMEVEEERLEQMKELLSRLPRVNYQSLKALIEHLCIIAEHSSQNRMPALNLAPVFGPTLLYRATDADSYGHTTAASDLVADMITFYSRLFQVEAIVLEKERQIQQALQKLKDAKLYQKPAGPILVGIYIYSKDWGRCLNMKLTPTTTALDICEYAISIGSVREVADKLAVFEVVCNGDLERPLHYNESVLQVALKWMNWDSQDAKDNYLCIKHNSLYDAILPYTTVGKPLSVFGQLKFADRGSKSYKKCQYQFTAAKLKCFKMVKFFTQESQQDVGEWKVEEITWYTGVDIKRSAPTRWVLTFIDRDAAVKRSRSQAYFGRSLSLNTEEDFHKLIAAMLVAEHPEGLLPERCLPDLLS